MVHNGTQCHDTTTSNFNVYSKSDLEVAQKGPPAGTNLRNRDKVGQNANPETR